MNSLDVNLGYIFPKEIQDTHTKSILQFRDKYTATVCHRNNGHDIVLLYV